MGQNTTKCHASKDIVADDVWSGLWSQREWIGANSAPVNYKCSNDIKHGEVDDQ